jgi:hypothetical protein
MPALSAWPVLRFESPCLRVATAPSPCLRAGFCLLRLGWWCFFFLGGEAGLAFGLAGVAHGFDQGAVRACGWITEHRVDYELHLGEAQVVGVFALIDRLRQLVLKLIDQGARV